MADSGIRGRLFLAFFVTGLSMRTAVTSVGATLDALQEELRASAAAAGVITTLPVVCFAIVGGLTPRMARRLGPHALLVASLACATVGLAARPWAGSTAQFALVTAATLIGSAVSNVLMPTLVRLHFPDRVGLMTAVYTTALAAGAAAGAGLTVPLGQVAGDWRGGLAAWSIVGAAALVLWVPSVRTTAVPAHDGVDRLPLVALVRSRTAWAVAIFFGAVSMQAYIAFGWFARFLVDHGVRSAEAGLMLAGLTALAIPLSMTVPRLAPRFHRIAVGTFVCCLAVAYSLMAFAPAVTAWAWMLLAGVGGGAFPLALTLLGTRGRTVESTVSLSAFAQAIGYTMAAVGPLLFGTLHEATGSWLPPIALLFAALLVMAVASVPATRQAFVDYEA